MPSRSWLVLALFVVWFIPRPARADEAPLVVVCAAHSAEAKRLEDELGLVGFRVATKDPHTRACAAPSADTTTVTIERSGVHVVTEPGGSHTELVRASGESPNAFALRTAEHVRGRLLPSGARPVSPPPAPYRLVVHAGPALVLATYGSPALAVVGDVTYFWGRVGLGPFVLATLTSTPWKKERAQFTQRQTTVGAGGRYVLYRAANPGLELHGLVNAGVRFQRLEALKGDAAGVFAETATAFTFGAAFEVLYSPSDWFAFGGQTGVQLGVPLAWPAPVDTLDNPAQRALENVAGGSSVDGALSIAAVASFRF